MDRGAWQAKVHGVTKSQTWLLILLRVREKSTRLTAFQWAFTLELGLALHHQLSWDTSLLTVDLETSQMSQCVVI